MDTARRWHARWEASTPGRTVKRYSAARGNVLGAGMAYYAVFSIFPALAVGFTAFARFLGGRQDLQAELVEYVNTTFGFAVVALTEADEGLVTVDQLVQGTAVGVAGVVGALVLLYTGLGWLSATRQGVRAVFDQPPLPNLVLGKLRDLGVLATLGVLVLVSIAASVAVTVATGTILDWLGLSRSAWSSLAVTAMTTLALVVVDALIFLLFFRLLAGVAVPVRDLVPGAVLGAIGLGLLKLGGGVLLRMAGGNQFLAAFGVLVGLLLWMNFAARLTLLAAAWAATTSADRGHLPAAAGAAPQTPPAPEPDAAEPGYSVRAADRVTLTAGVLLGAGSLMAARVVSGAARAAVDALRDRSAP